MGASSRLRLPGEGESIVRSCPDSRALLLDAHLNPSWLLHIGPSEDRLCVFSCRVLRGLFYFARFFPSLNYPGPTVLNVPAVCPTVHGGVFPLFSSFPSLRLTCFLSWNLFPFPDFFIHMFL